MWSQPQFDEHQFEGRKYKAVSAHATQDGFESTGIAFSDFGRMHITKRAVRRKRRLPVPEWAVNTTSMRAVVLKFLENRLYIHDTHGTDDERLQRIKEVAKYRLPHLEAEVKTRLQRYHAKAAAGAGPEELRTLAIEAQNADTALMIQRKGLAETAFAVVHYYYNLGMASTQVANTLGVKPPMVRIWLYRMNFLARGKTPPISKLRVLPEYMKARLRAVWALKAAGKTTTECAAIIGVSTGSMNRYFKYLGKVEPHKESDKHVRVTYKSGGKKVEYWRTWPSRPKVAKPKGPKRPKSKIQKWTPERLTLLFDLRRQGVTLVECAVALNCASPSTVNAALRNYRAKYASKDQTAIPALLS